jgi:hypothetical protein
MGDGKRIDIEKEISEWNVNIAIRVIQAYIEEISFENKIMKEAIKKMKNEDEEK